MIGKLIQMYRTKYDIGVRELAKELGMSAATLSRIENGKPCDQENMLRLINWLFKERQ